MLRDQGHIADCWIVGVPKKDGFYLTRWEKNGNAWWYLFECCNFEGHMLYCDGYGGSRQWDQSMYRLGSITHHCEMTPQNFEKIINSIRPFKFDKNKWKYIEIK